MADVGLSITRTQLGLAALVIGGNRDELVSVVGGTIARPARSHRLTYADPSPFVPGSLVTASVAEHTNLAFKLQVLGATDAGVASAVAAVEAALSQFSYRVTLTLRGSSSTWKADAGQLTPDQLTPGDALSQRRVYQVTIPVYPHPVAP